MSSRSTGDAEPGNAQSLKFVETAAHSLTIPGVFRGVSPRNGSRAALTIGGVLGPADDVAAIPMSLMAIH